MTNKKKPKRVDTRRAVGEENAARRRKFYESGVPISLVLLFAFIMTASLVLAVNVHFSPDEESLLDFDLRRTLILGTFMLVLSGAMGLYVAAHEGRIVKMHLRGAVLLLALLIMIVFVRIGVIRQWPPYFIVVPTMITAIMMTIAYSQRFALGISSFLALVSILALAERDTAFKEAVALMVVTGSGIGIAILLLKEIRTRSKLLEVCGVAGLVVFVLIWMAGLWENLPTARIAINSGVGGLGAVLGGFGMQGLLPLIERVFRVATNMTLLDHGQPTRPLLKRLAIEAPGTFNHSWQIGMLSEAAAEAIGANGLLCRVGSYYHDVGKLNKPHYFVENQAEAFNQHKELSPTMSRMIIIGHVKDGLELVRQYRVPKVLHQFIETHHGKTVVEYFYYEATKRESQAGRTVDEVEFRYPGPKPSTKEAAIVMLADAVEGATRAMQEPTPNRIETVVHNMAMKRLQDGQFDRCDLTMRELHLLVESLVKSLCAMYHGRITYPKHEALEKMRMQTG